jgi:hypothetical protein
VADAPGRIRAIGTDLGARAQRLHAVEKGLVLAAHGPRVAWPDRRSVHLPGIRFVRALTEALQERSMVRPHGKSLAVDVVSARDGERAVLKRKRAAAASETAKKLREREKEREVGVLKAKLSAIPPDPSRDRGKLQAVTAPRTEPPASRALTCRIVLWRGYVKSEFHAKVTTAEGQKLTVFASPSFRWRKPEPPPREAPEIARAHSTLVEELGAAGWVATGNGDEWYSLEFERRGTLPAAEKGDQ